MGQILLVQLCGMKVVAIACDAKGNVDLDDLKLKAEKHSNELAALMVTYPSTHGARGAKITSALLSMPTGASLHGWGKYECPGWLCRPGDFGADVCHLNLHKTFCIPLMAGGPGVMPHLVAFLPGHSVISTG